MKMKITMAVPAWLALWITPLAAADLWVSPEGDDEAAGTKAEPLRTLNAARLAVRKHPRLGKEPVAVHLAGGVYYLPEALVFTAGDSGAMDAPVVFKGAPDGQVVLSGGQPVEAEWKPYREGIMQAKVPEGFVSDQLFLNGRRQPMARFPDYDPEAQYFQGFSEKCTSPEKVKSWKDPSGGYLHAMHSNLWGDMHWRITGKTDGGKLEMVGGWQNNRQMGGHRKFRFVENIFEELDAPGEWFLDSRAGTLYYHPPEGVDLGTARVEAVRLPCLVEFRGSEDAPVRHIVLEGLTLTHTARTFMDNKEPLLRSDWTTWRGGAVFFNGAEDCALRDCFVDQAGSNAVFVNNYNRRISIVGCHLAEAGASGVSFVGDPDSVRSPLFEYGQTQTLGEMDKTPGPRTSNYPAGCLVEDCLIRRSGRIEKQTAGVNIAISEGVTVRHCSIYDCPRAGINICDGCFGGHLIEFNDVFDTVKETGDHGSFNSWGRDRFWHKNRGVTAQWVKQHPDMPAWDCRKTIVIRNSRWRCDHGWDIDLDDGSSNYRICNNLCLAGGIKLREGYNRVVENNIMINWTFCPHVWYPDCNTTFKHNILSRDSYRPAGMGKTDQGANMDYNLAHDPDAKEPRPAVKLQAFAKGGEQHSIVADAMFVAPERGDYRVRDSSPALDLGFKNFPMDRFGVRKPELKAIARTPPLPGTLEAAHIASRGWDRKGTPAESADWNGASVRDLRDENDMSAMGLGDTNGVLVAELESGSKAAAMGLRVNDVIRGVNGTGVKNLAEFSRRYTDLAGSGKPITLDLWRNQEPAKLAVRP